MMTYMELWKATSVRHELKQKNTGNYILQRSRVEYGVNKLQSFYFQLYTNKSRPVESNWIKVLTGFTLLFTFLLLSPFINAQSKNDTIEYDRQKTELDKLSLPLPSGLLSSWSGDGHAQDSEGSNNGTMHYGAGFGTGKMGQAFKFDGKGYVQASTTNLPTGNSDRTLMMWVKINSFYPGEAFFAIYGASSKFEATYYLGTSDSTLFFSQWGQTVFGPQLKRNKWYHIACSNIGNELTLYLDGNVVASGTLPIDTPSGSQFYIGKIPEDLEASRKLNGLVDEVQIYNRALDASEIQAIINTVTVSLTTPNNIVKYTAPARIRLLATTSDENKNIKRVQFYNGSTLIHTETIFPYGFTWKNVSLGEYILTAKAIHTDGKVTISKSIQVSVVEDIPPSITSLAKNTSYTEPATASSRLSAIETQPKEISLTLAPNPVRNTLQIKTIGFLPATPATVVILSASSRVLKTLSTTGSNLTLPINVSSIASGVYIIKVIQGDKVWYKRFVKL